MKFNDMKVLIATEKPFAKKAVDGIKKIITDAGYEVALLEKYTDKAQLLAAVADANALIIRSDKVTAEVIGSLPRISRSSFVRVLVTTTWTWLPQRLKVSW